MCLSSNTLVTHPHKAMTTKVNIHTPNLIENADVLTMDQDSFLDLFLTLSKFSCILKI